MCTSPQAMRLRPRARRAPVALAAVVLAVALVAACSDDGGDDDTSPTTTSPTPQAEGGADEPEPGPSTTAPGGDEEPPPSTGAAPTGGGDQPAGGDEGDVLSDAQVSAELRRLYDDYVAAFVAARERGAVDEAFRADLARIFAPELLANELDGIDSIGGLGAVVPQPAAVGISTVRVEVSEPGCASGSAVFDLRPLVGDRVPGPLTRYFKLEQSEAQPGWRFSALGSTESGDAFAGASCEGG